MEDALLAASSALAEEGMKFAGAGGSGSRGARTHSAPDGSPKAGAGLPEAMGQGRAGSGMGGAGIGAGGQAPKSPGPSGVGKTDSRVTGRLGQGPQVVSPVRGAADRAEARASYSEVYPSARRAAEEALTREQVPAGYRRPVKEYFESIAPP